MSYSIVFKFPDTTTFDASTILTQRMVVKESLHNNYFESNRNVCTFETLFDSTLLSKIESASGFTMVEVKDGSTWLFNGVLQPLSDFSISNSRDTLEFELQDRGALLEYCLTSPAFFNSTSIQSIVNSLLTGSGVSFSSYPSRASTAQAVRGVFGTTETVWKMLNQLLKEFGMVFHFLPDGTAEVVDLMVNISSTVTINDSTNAIINDGSLKVKKNSAKGRGEKISVQADYYEAFSQKSKVYGFAMSRDNYGAYWTGTGMGSHWQSVAWYESNFFPGVANQYTYPATELVLLDEVSFNFSKPNSAARYLGAELPSYTMKFTTGDCTASVTKEAVIVLTVDTAGNPTLKRLAIGANPAYTFDPADFVFSQTIYADKLVVSLKITNDDYFTAYSSDALDSTTMPRKGVLFSASIDATVWLGTHVEPIKVTNPKSKVESYTLDYCQTSSQVQDFLNLRSDIANNRNFDTDFSSYTSYAIKTGVTISIARNGFSTSGVLVEKTSNYSPSLVEYQYKLTAYSTISLTTPTTVTAPAIVPPAAPVMTPTGEIVQPIVSTAIQAANVESMTVPGFVIGQTDVGFYDPVAGEWTFRVKDTGEIFAGGTTNNLTFDPATGDLTLTGDIVAGGGTVAGWIIASDLLKSASSGARIELNKTKSRVSIFDASNEIVAMGYLDGLIDPVTGLTLTASDYGFWAKNGNKITFKAGIVYEAAQQVKNNLFQVLDASNNVKVTLGDGSGIFSGLRGVYVGDYASPSAYLNETTLGIQTTKGLFYINNDDTTDQTQVSTGEKTLKIFSQGNSDGGTFLSKLELGVFNNSGVFQSCISMQYTVANGLQITPAQFTALGSASTITAGTGLTVTSGGATITAGGLTVSAGGAAVTGNSTITGDLQITGNEYTAAFTDYSSTSTVVGWSSTTTKKIYYKKIGKLVYVWFQIVGTSNSNTVTFTTPYNAAQVFVNAVGIAQDAGTYLGATSIISAAGSNVLTCYRAGTANGWTNSGTKQVTGQFFFEEQ